MKQIYVGKGVYTKVDDEDFDRIVAYGKWGLANGYPATTSYRPAMYMHNLIMQPPFGKEVDHINHIKTDNQKSNLRIGTRRQNHANHRLRKDNSSGYKGVDFHRGRGWRARVAQNGKRISLGYFRTELEAAIAYDEEALRLFGEFAHLNFPVAKESNSIIESDKCQTS